MTKQQLRVLYKKKRAELSDIERENASKSILQQLKALDIWTNDYFHIFLPIEKQLEINTYPIIDYILSLNKKIIVPISDFKTNTMTNCLYEKQIELAYSELGIPEPTIIKKIEFNQIQVILIPLLISDKQNNRVGYGKGFYDKFLAECPVEVLKIGLNYFSPIDQITDSNHLDIQLDILITPNKVYLF